MQGFDHRIPDCEECGNARHIRQGKKFVRCRCLSAWARRTWFTSFGYSDSLVAADELIEALPAHAIIYGPGWRPFVYGSLFQLPVGTSFHYITEANLADVSFSKDKGKPEIFGLYEYDVLAVIAGLQMPPFKYDVAGQILGHLIEERRVRGKPVWLCLPKEDYVRETTERHGHQYNASIEYIVASIDDQFTITKDGLDSVFEEVDVEVDTDFEEDVEDVEEEGDE